jgi:Serine/threonine protein kinase
MGEVYRARDSKLGRDVAIKVVSEDFAKDPGRVGRFQREAHVLASLNHPNIASIYDLAEAGHPRPRRAKPDRAGGLLSRQ